MYFITQSCVGIINANISNEQQVGKLDNEITFAKLTQGYFDLSDYKSIHSQSS